MIDIQTLKEVIIKTERILSLKARDVYVDRGYSGHNYTGDNISSSMIFNDLYFTCFCFSAIIRLQNMLLSISLSMNLTSCRFMNPLWASL